MIPVAKLFKPNPSVVRRQQKIVVGEPIPVAEFLGLIPSKLVIHEGMVVSYHNRRVGLDGFKWRVFKDKGVKCKHCGRQGKVVLLEKSFKNNDPPRFNLYAIKDDGSLLLMTIDHIVPKSRGGSNELNNLQPLCCECNGKKDNKTEEELYRAKIISGGI